MKKSSRPKKKEVAEFQKLDRLFGQWHAQRLYGNILLSEIPKSFPDVARENGLSKVKVRKWAWFRNLKPEIRIMALKS